MLVRDQAGEWPDAGCDDVVWLKADVTGRVTLNPLEAVLEHEEDVDQELLGTVFGDLLFRPLQPEVFGDDLLEWPEADVDRIAENCADVGRLPTGPGRGPDGWLWNWILAHAIRDEL